MVGRPNNDLGTAHGRIVIDFEDRGSAKAAATLAQVEKQFQVLNQRLAKIEKSLSDYDRSLDSTSRSLSKASRETKVFSSSVFGGSRGVRGFSKDVKGLTDDVIALSRAYDVAREKLKPWQDAYRVLDRYQQLKLERPVRDFGRALGALKFTSLIQGERNIRDFTRALRSVGVIPSFKEFTGNVLGIKSAMSQMPVWTQGLYRLSLTLAKVGAIGLAAGKALNAGFITNFLNTGVFRKIVQESERAGGALQKLGGITERFFGKNMFGGFSAKLKDSENILDKFVRNTEHSMSGLSRAFNAGFAPVAQFAKQAKGFVVGSALFAAGMNEIIDNFRWLGKIPKPILMALGIVIGDVLPAALQKFGQVLSWVSNTLLGLLDGIKQLSGGLLVIPGFLAQIGVVAGTLVTIFGNLKDAFKDVFSDDPAKAAEAFAKLPEHLKPMAKALKETVDNFKKMRIEIQKTAFKGIEDQIKSLSEKYMPLLSSGMTNVTMAIRAAKDQFVQFAETAQTQKDFAKLFGLTTQSLYNLGNAVRPAMEGLRNIGMVGAQFVTNLTGSMPGLIAKFNQWTRVNRENGMMMKWMQDARTGMRDLFKGTWDLTKALWSMLTIFKTNNGTNWLESYAKSMAKFNESVKRSAAVGFLRNLGNSVRSLGTDKIAQFKDLFGRFVDMMKFVGPAVQEVSNTFAKLFIPAIQSAMSEFRLFAMALSELGITKAIGVILGLVAIFKIVPGAIKPVWAAVKTLWGSFLMMQNAGKMFSVVQKSLFKLSDLLGHLPIVGDRAAASMERVATSTQGFASKLAAAIGPVMTAIVVLTTLWGVFSTAQNNIKEFDAQLKANADSLNNFRKNLNEAFIEDRGLVGKTVMDTVSSGLAEMLNNLDDTASKAPKFIDHIYDLFDSSNSGKNKKKQGKSFFSESDFINQRQAEGDAAEKAAKKLKELQRNGVDLAAVLTSSKPAFDGWIASLRHLQENDAADFLEKQRHEYDLISESMRRMGPLGVQLAAGLKKIADAGGDAASKLDGVKLALQGLGFLKTDALEAAANYTTTLGDLADQVREVVAQGGDISTVWDQANNSLNTSSQLGAKLVPIFKSVSDAYIQAVTADPSKAGEAGERLKQSLNDIAPLIGTTGEKLQQFFREWEGFAPEPIQLMLQLANKDKLAQDLGSFLLQLSASAENNVPVVVHFDSEFAANEFDKWLEKALGRDITDQNGVDVVLKPGIAPPSPEELAKLQAALAQYGIQTTPGQVVSPAQMPVAPVPAPPPVQQPAPLPITTPPAWPPMSTPDGQPEAPATFNLAPLPDISKPIKDASAAVDEVGGKMRNLLANKENKIELNTEKLTEAQTKIEEVTRNFSQNKLKAEVEVTGGDKLNELAGTAQTVSDKVTGLFSTFKDQVIQAVESVSTRIAELSGSVITELENLAQKASTAGSKFVDAFADGMSANPRAVQAARQLAEDVIAQYHQSPPKEGPLAKHGDAAKYAGRQFVKSYATGLEGSLPVASKAASSVAGAAGSAVTGGPGAQAGQFLGQILRLVNFASAVNDIFKRVADTVVSAMRFISDPKGDGTFFGKRRYQKTVSDEELQKRQNDRLNSAYLQMQDGAQRNNDRFNERLDIITNAQNAVSDARGYKSGEAAQTVGAALKAAFPQLADATIGGARPDALPYHREGRAIDVMIPNWDTEEGKQLGDQIAAWALQNAKKLGVEDTIWRDFWQPGDGSQGNFLNRTGQGPTQAHMDHVHITFAPGAQVDLTGLQFTPEEARAYREDAAQNDKKKALQRLQEQYGPPVDPNNLPATPATQLQWNDATKTYDIVTPHGTQSVPTLGPLNPETQQPWTDAERQRYIQENPLQYTLPDGFTKEQMDAVANNPGEFSQQNQEDILKQLASTNADVAEALKIRDNPGDFASLDPNRVASILETLDTLQSTPGLTDTAGGRIKNSAIEGLKSSVMDVSGFSQSANPIDSVGSVVSEATGMASDVINVVVTAIESVGAVKNITDTLVRGVANTEDIYKNIDNVQKIFELFAGVAGAVGSVAGLAGTIVGAAGTGDTSGSTQAVAAALGAVNMIAGFVQSAWEITNALIDLGQEVYRIAGSYVGDFLGYLVGGPDGPLAGNVKFLLDQQTNQLLSYATENPMDKRVFDIPRTQQNEDIRKQLVGNINVYGGPGSDPRDLTRQMMFQVNAAQYTGALAS